VSHCRFFSINSLQISNAQWRSGAIDRMMNVLATGMVYFTAFRPDLFLVTNIGVYASRMLFCRRCFIIHVVPIVSSRANSFARTRRK